jgi:thioesterase domain-containing protein
MAAHNISEIQKIQPQGPYFLMGVCIGGVVAFEMARQLEVQGEKVSLLALLHPSVLKRADERTVAKALPESIMLLKFVYRRLLLYWRTFTELGPDERLAYLGAKGRMVWSMISQRDLFRGDRSEIGRIRVIEALTAALHSYAPKPYPGVASLLLASKQQSPSTRDPRLDWRDYVLHGLDIYELPAEDSVQVIKEPHLHATVVALKACLRKARA